MMTLRNTPCGMHKRQRGLSLIELMISMVLGLLLIGGIIALFISNKQTYRYNEELARLQENSRIAIDRIERTMRMAGHLGCVSLLELATSTQLRSESIVASPTIDIDSFEGISAATYSASAPGIVGALGLTGVNGTDMLTVRYGQSASVGLATGSDTINKGVSSITIANNALGFTQGEPIVLADCKGVGLARISNTPASGDNIPLSFSSAGGYNLTDGFQSLTFDEFVKIMRLNVQSLFIAQSADTNRQGNAYNSLYLASQGAGGVATAVELAPGVVDMIVTYGTTSTSADGNVEKYQSASDVADWNQVMAVNIQLLMSSVDDNVVAEDQAVAFNGTTYTDRRMYNVVSTTIALRRAFD